MMIPKYVQDLMSRSRYDFDFGPNDDRCAAGYTIRIRKATPYTKIPAFLAELDRLQKWCRRVCPDLECCSIIQVPTATHYCSQSATVTIWDPLMQKLEGFMSERK